VLSDSSHQGLHVTDIRSTDFTETFASVK
jgi:hypothetical protein